MLIINVAINANNNSGRLFLVSLLISIVEIYKYIQIYIYKCVVSNGEINLLQYVLGLRAFPTSFSRYLFCFCPKCCTSLGMPHSIYIDEAFEKRSLSQIHSLSLTRSFYRLGTPRCFRSPRTKVFSVSPSFIFSPKNSINAKKFVGVKTIKSDASFRRARNERSAKAT